MAIKNYDILCIHLSFLQILIFQKAGYVKGADLSVILKLALSIALPATDIIISYFCNDFVHITIPCIRTGLLVTWNMKSISHPIAEL